MTVVQGAALLMLLVSGILGDQEEVNLIATFPGDSAVGPKANPDNVGAVGPEHVVDFTCANFVVHDKKGGKVLQRKSQPEF